MKDPAFPLYSADFLIGVFGMSDDNTGKYIKLMCLQHQKGRLSEEEFKTVAPNPSPELLKKFKIDSSKRYYNERLEAEILKRAKFKQKQIENIQKRWDSDTNSLPTLYQNGDLVYTKQIPLEDENENINENKKKFIAPTEIEVIKYFEENGFRKDVAQRAFKYYNEMDWHDSRDKPIKRWKGKMVAVWFKDENRQIVKGRVNLTQLSNERKNHLQ